MVLWYLTAGEIPCKDDFISDEYIGFSIRASYCTLHLHLCIQQTPLSKATYSAFRLYILSLCVFCVPWELNPQAFTPLTQCSITESQEHSDTWQFIWSTCTCQQDGISRKRKLWVESMNRKRSGWKEERSANKEERISRLQTLNSWVLIVRFLLCRRRTYSMLTNSQCS